MSTPASEGQAAAGAAPPTPQGLADFLQRFHESFGSQLASSDFVFFNYGMAPTARGARLELEDQPHQQHLELLRTLIEPLDLAGATVIEIGSGRGGNCDYLRRYTEARRIIGVDLCASYLDFSRRSFARDGLAFVEGDAQKLPFAAESADCVLSIQSAHCCPDFEALLSEIARVLKPGGMLALADIWDLELFPYDWRMRKAQLLECGLVVTLQRDITHQVCEALAQADGFAASMALTRTETNSTLLDSMTGGFEAIQKSLLERRSSYRLYRLQKPHCEGRRQLPGRPERMSSP